MVAQTSNQINQRSRQMRSISTGTRPTGAGVGYCLNCGERLSYCGRAFSTEIRCSKCGKVNIYEDSQQPKRVRA